MTDALRLRGLRCDVFLGVSDAERARPQTVELDVELRLDLREAGRADDPERTVDYAEVVEAIRRAVDGRSFRLVEALAERAAQAASRFGAEEVVVRARKFQPPVKGGLDHAEVEVVRRPIP